MLQDTLVISVWFVFASDYENRKFYFNLCNAFYIINNREFLICKFVKDITWREKKGEGVGLLWLKARKLFVICMKCIAQLKQAQWNYSIFDVVEHW